MPRSRRSPREFAKLLDRAAMPIYVLDHRRRIIFCNAAMTQWLGCEESDLIGATCDYHAESGGRSEGQRDHAKDLVAGLCPPLEVFSLAFSSDGNGERVRAVVGCRNEAGEFVRRRGDFLPLLSDDSTATESVGVLAVLATTDLPEGDASARDSNSDAGSDGVIESGDEATRLHAQILALRQRLRHRYQLDRLVGNSPAARRVRSQVAMVAGQPSRTLVVGPSGSGREHVARSIYYANPRETFMPLVPLNSPLLDAELLQTTIATFVRRCAELDADEPGALLLLEADQLSSEAQAELMGFLNIPQFDLYIIATARRSLLDLARLGKFRYDLASALSTLVIELPALKERTEDIPLLAQWFLEKCNAQGKRQVGGFTAEAMDRLVVYDWPGNVDELIEMVALSHTQAKGPRVTVADLPDRILFAADAANYPPRHDEPIVLTEVLAEIERELIHRALQQSRGNKAQASRMLGMTRARFLRRLESLGINEDLS